MRRTPSILEKFKLKRETVEFQLYLPRSIKGENYFNQLISRELSQNKYDTTDIKFRKKKRNFYEVMIAFGTFI